MNSQKLQITAVGDLTADLILEMPRLPDGTGEFQIAESIQLEPGGNANLLILLARLGASASAIGALGKDRWGQDIFQILEAEGIDTLSIDREGTTTVALVFVDAIGQHSFIGVFGQGARLQLTPGKRTTTANTDALFASGYSLKEDRLLTLTLEVLETAGQAGVPRFFDPGPAFSALETAVQQRALAATDILLATEEELADLSSGGAERLLRNQNSGEQSGPHTVVEKRGAGGCRVFQPEQPTVVEPGLQVAVRDTTAAGDCFDAGYLWAYLRGWSPLNCAQLANCTGAAAVQKLGGGRNVPTREEIRQMISQFGGNINI